jgi:hypothetical protein
MMMMVVRWLWAEVVASVWYLLRYISCVGILHGLSQCMTHLVAAQGVAGFFEASVCSQHRVWHHHGVVLAQRHVLDAALFCWATSSYEWHGPAATAALLVSCCSTAVVP